MVMPIDPEQHRFVTFCVLVCALICVGLVALCVATLLLT